MELGARVELGRIRWQELPPYGANASSEARWAKWSRRARKFSTGGIGHVLLIERDQRPHRLYRIWSKSGPDTFAADPQAWDGTRGHGGGTNRLTRSR
jgi:hypothetical protein